MKISTLGILVFYMAFSASLIAQEPMFSTPLSSRVANYDISLQLDTEKKIIDAKETITWNNPSGDTIRELRLHVYLNAFSNSQSSWLSEAGGVPQHSLRYEDYENIWAWSEVSNVRDEAGNDLTAGMKYIQPDDGNEHDKTVLSIPLQTPVMPFGSTTIHLDFMAKMPKAMVRTGYSKNYFFVVQWFPKLGVYEPAGMRFATEGAWNCHQYHRSGEYYANFGNYNVDITLPSQFIVGASGLKYKEEEKGDMKTHYYHAEDVIDFAWTASPRFVEINDEWEDIDIRLLISPEHEYLKDRYLGSLKNALEYLAKHIEKYPYPNVTVVVPPFHATWTSSMEYPTLFSTPGLYGLPDDIRVIETITIHEFIHQYFMMMVASNEMEEAWLDEGFTTYWESRILDHYYGDKTSSFDVLGFRSGSIESNRAGFTGMFNPKIAPVATQPRHFIHGGYSPISYNKPGVWLETLAGLVGEDTNEEIWRTYFSRWKFKHPCGPDFIEVVNEVVTKNHGDQFGKNMDWFFDQVLYGTEECDYDVAFFSNVERTPPYGIIDDKDNPVKSTDVLDKGMGIYDSKVVLYRLGEVIFPQEVLVQFENGESVLEYWDGKSRSHEFTYETESKIECVIIDPDHKIYLDKNFNNNSLSVKTNKTGIRKYVAKFLLWVQNAMATAAMFA